MLEFLTPAWCEAFMRIASAEFARPDVTLRVQYQIKMPGGEEVVFYQVIDGGHLRDMKMGAAPVVDLTVTFSYATALRLFNGELGATTAAFRGLMKLNGKMAHALAMRTIVVSDEYKLLLNQARAFTFFRSAA